MPVFVVEPNRIPGYNEVRFVSHVATKRPAERGSGETHFFAAILFGLTAVTPLWATLLYFMWR